MKRCLKRSSKWMIAFSLPFFLTSCFSLFIPNRQDSIIVPGYFFATPENESAPFNYELEVHEIAKEEFDQAGMVNVVKDELTGRFYRLLLTKIHRVTGEITDYTFENLYDRNPEAVQFSIDYEDDNGTILIPTEEDEGASYTYSSYMLETKEVFDDLSFGTVYAYFQAKWNPVPAPRFRWS